MLTTPRAMSLSNLRRIGWSVTMDSMGGASVEGRALYRGAEGMELRDELLLASPGARRFWLETELAGRCPGILLDTLQIEGLTPVADSLVVRYMFRTASFCSVPGTEPAIRPWSYSSSRLPALFRAPTRVHPVRLSYGLQSVFDLEVRLPVSWKVRTLEIPRPLTSKFGFGTWSMQSRDDGSLHASATLLLEGEDISPDEYGQFQAFLDDIHMREMKEVRLQLQVGK
jgi:hypothetical protein